MNQAELLGMRILIVDDEPVNVALLDDLLRFCGFKDIASTTDSRRVLKMCAERRPDLILLDLNMPYLDGYSVLAQLGAEFHPGEWIPILVLTADISLDAKRRALAGGATDFLTKPFDPVEAQLRITNLLRTRHQHLQLSDQKRLLEDCVQERTTELSRTLEQLRAAQAQAIQHERLSALGSMTAGIAHDFNNVLSLILGYSEMLLRSIHQPNGVKTADALLGTIITAAQDAAKMFSRLREFYRPADKTQTHELLNLNELVEQAIELTRPRWHGQALGQGANIELDTNLAAGLPSIMADGSEMREMLTNLIFNAVDAMPKGGILQLGTRLDTTPNLPADAHAATPAAGQVIVLEVRDSGLGMTEEVRRRCLEPFFTTKGKHGTGLGLAMVYGIMQRHHGSIDLRSTPGEGTTFTLSFPIIHKSAPAFLAETNRPVGPLRILAVDDQPILCEILVEYLSADWHSVQVACAGEEALEMFRSEPFDLVITDRAMPGISGEELAAGVKAISPQTRVILLTGYASGGDRSRHCPWVDLVVDKPATRETLKRAVQRVMSDAPRDATPARHLTDVVLAVP